MKKLIALISLVVFTVAAVKAADIELSWAANPAEDQVRHYFIYQATGTGTFVKVADAGTNLTHTVTNLTPGVYRFQIRAANIWQVESEVETTVSTPRSEEHTYELQSLMRISYAVFCLK